MRLFLFSFGVIYFSRPMLHFLTGTGVYEIFKFKRVSLSSSEVFDWHTAILISLLGLQIGYRYYILRAARNRLDLSRYGMVLTKLLLFIFYPYYLISALNKFQILRRYGYLSSYDGGISESLIEKLVGYIVLVLFAIIFANRKLSRFYFFFFASIFLFPELLVSLYGARGDFLLSLMYIMWVAYQRRTFINWRYVVIGVLFLMPILFGLVTKRYEAENISLLLSIMLSELGNSSLIIPYMSIADLPGFYKVPMLLAPFQIIPFAGQTYEYLDVTWGLGHHLTAALSKTSYLKGEGIGSSFIGELSQLGLVGIFIGSYALGAVIKYFDYSYDYSFAVRVFAIILVPHILFVPRTSLFPPLITFLIFVTFFFLYSTLCRIIKK